MFVGTASDVGKSILCTAFCRIFKQDGYHPAPFKAQNMSLNSYATPDGLEIGRAQAVQAEAAGVPCHTDMNPVLLKPTSHTGSQVVLNGVPTGNQSAYHYFNNDNRTQLFEHVATAFDRLRQQHNPIVMEGAGSISELNLKDKDIVNMRMARHANASTILVTDIDRGGVFASVYGSIMLLPEEERRLIKGVIINKFRGDPRLFESGKKMIQDITGVPVLGVIPYFDHIRIDEEDSVAIARKQHQLQPEKVNICIIRLPRISNYTDFDVFEKINGVNLFYSDNPHDILHADIIIMPGSKNTMEDLIHIRDTGIEQSILQAADNKKAIVGICGGYQMMGQMIEDPDHIESEYDIVRGMGLLPLKTTLLRNKLTRQRQFYFRNANGKICEGYEIHVGRSEILKEDEPVNTFIDGEQDGCWQSAKCWGTYIHGIFDNQPVLASLLKPFEIDLPDFDYKRFKERQYDALADLVRENTDMQKIYKILK